MFSKHCNAFKVQLRMRASEPSLFWRHFTCDGLIPRPGGGTCKPHSIFYPKTGPSCIRPVPPCTQRKPKGNRMATAILNAGDIENTVLHFTHSHDGFRFDKCPSPCDFPWMETIASEGMTSIVLMRYYLKDSKGSLWPLIG